MKYEDESDDYWSHSLIIIAFVSQWGVDRLAHGCTRR